MTAPAFGAAFTQSPPKRPRSQQAQQPSAQAPEQRSAPVAQAQQPQTQTFAQMQASGVARPAPPSGVEMYNGGMVNQQQTPPAQQQFLQQVQQAAQLSGGQGPPPQAMGLSAAGNQQPSQALQMLQQQVQQAMAGGGTRYDTDTYQQIHGAAMGNITADFDRQRAMLDEEMARRGLYDSTYAAQGYQDLGGQQARAMADLNATLLRDAAATGAEDRSALASMTGQLADISGSQRLQEMGLSQEAQQNELQRMLQLQMQGNDLGFNREQLGQQNRQFERSAGQQDFMNQLNRELGIGELSGTINGQNTVGRDRATAEADLARQQMLMTMLSMLGYDTEAFRNAFGIKPPPQPGPDPIGGRRAGIPERQDPVPPGQGPPTDPYNSPRTNLMTQWMGGFNG